MDKNIYEILTDNALNERFDSILLKNELYQEIQNEINQLREKVHDIDLSKEQRLIVDRLVSINIESGCYYGRLAYQQGIKDCALLLREMDLIK